MGFIGWATNKVVTLVSPKKAGLAGSNLILSPESAIWWAERKERRMDKLVTATENRITRIIRELLKTPERNRDDWARMTQQLDTEFKTLESYLHTEIEKLVEVDLQIEYTFKTVLDSIVSKLALALKHARVAGLSPVLYAELQAKYDHLKNHILKTVDDIRLEDRRQARGATVLSQFGIRPTSWILRSARRLSSKAGRERGRELRNLKEMADSFSKGDENNFKQAFESIVDEVHTEIEELEAIADDNLVVAYRSRKSLESILAVVNKLPEPLRNRMQTRTTSLLSYEQKKLDDVRRTMVYAYQQIREALHSEALTA
ncbi:MAG: hypothetical protein AABX52_01055 [Nanoarchaeota archaeon]